MIAVYSLVFRYYIRFGNVEHYTLFLFAGLLPWIWFSTGLLEATAAISSGGSLITKAMFPPHILPIVSVLTNMFNFLFAIPILIGFMFLCDVLPSWTLLLFPVVVFFELLFLVGLGLAFAALNVHFRDIQHILGNFLTFWFFLSPVLYPTENVPEQLKFSLFLNPIAYFSQMYQAIFAEGLFPDFKMFLVIAIISLLTFCVGNIVFNRYREDFAELI